MEVADLVEVYHAQGAFFNSKQTLSLDFRLWGLAQLEKMVKAQEADLLKALGQDLGKHATESYMTELGLIYQSIRQAKKNLRKWARPKRVKTPLYLWPARSRILPVPFGRTLIISPFNYPLLLSLDPLVGALAAGNVALVALSELTPQVNKVLLAGIEAYFPSEYLYFFVSDPVLNAELLKEPFAKIFFTGSPRVGQLVATAASQHLTPVTLELGGKSPALITESGNLALAAERIVWGKFLNAGQTCVAPDYCLVPAAQVAEFTQLAVAQLQIFYGETPSTSPDYGRIVSQAHLKRLRDLLLADADYLVKGGTVETAQRYLAPTLLQTDLETVLQGKLATMEEEIFGPILPIISYRSLPEALAFIQSQHPPLAFYPFSEDHHLTEELLEHVSFGGATVNDTVLHLSNPSLPFGGVGRSGMGRYHGYASFTTFSHEKSILWRSRYFPLTLMHPPYTTGKDRLIKKFLK